MNMTAIEWLNAVQNVLLIIKQDLVKRTAIPLRNSHQNIVVDKTSKLHARINVYPISEYKHVLELFCLGCFFVFTVAERLSQIVIYKVRRSQLDVNITEAITGQFVQCPISIFWRAPIQFDEYFIPEFLEGFIDFLVKLWKVGVVLCGLLCVPVCWIVIWKIWFVVV